MHPVHVGRRLAAVVLLLVSAVLVLPSGSLATNQPPVADAGSDQQAKVGGIVFFGGSGSTDPDKNDSLRYSWDFDSRDGIQNESTLIAPIHSFPAAGTYTVTLTVSDGKLDNADTMDVQVFANRPPVVELGQPVTAYTLETVYFDGRNASDPDGDPLTYAWDLDADGKVDTTDRLPNWQYTREGTYVVRLTVSDGTVNATGNLTVTVLPGSTTIDKKAFTDSEDLPPGREHAYFVTLREGDHLSVRITASAGTANVFLFTSAQYAAYTAKPGDASAIKKGTFFGTRSASYTFQADQSGEYVIVVQNPAATPPVPLTYSITINRGTASSTVPDAGALGVVLALAGIAFLLPRRARRDPVAGA